MNNSLTKKEREWIGKVKELPCSVCDAPAPSDAHHIEQGLQYCVVALCKDCHQNPKLGWHGERAMWKIKKMNELDALNVTIKRVIERLSV
jgi:hypothetical protein